MSFQILDSEGDIISLNELDKEACDFWNVQYDRTLYANPDPGEQMSNNWVDSIGWSIHYPQTNWTQGWDNVKNSLWITQANGLYSILYGNTDEFLERMCSITRFLKPYYDLIDHWASKGYTPCRKED